VIRDILLGHSGTTLTNWIVGWDIGWITELPENIDVTKENTNITSNYPTKTGTGASGTWGISITGNAATATKLAAAKNITIAGAVTGNTDFDGSENITITTSVNHNHDSLYSKAHVASWNFTTT